MTHELEHRVGQVEQEQARQGERLSRMERDLGDVSSGVKQLLERQQLAPSALTWKTIAATCGGMVTVYYVVSWLIAASPPVVDLVKRVDKLDDREIGRVPVMEKRLDRLDGWQPRVSRN